MLGTASFIILLALLVTKIVPGRGTAGPGGTSQGVGAEGAGAEGGTEGRLKPSEGRCTTRADGSYVCYGSDGYIQQYIPAPVVAGTLPAKRGGAGVHQTVNRPVSHTRKSGDISYEVYPTTMTEEAAPKGSWGVEWTTAKANGTTCKNYTDGSYMCIGPLAYDSGANHKKPVGVSDTVMPSTAWNEWKEQTLQQPGGAR